MRIDQINIENLSFAGPTNGKDMEVGYSFYFACAALVASILSIFAGIFSACFADIRW